LEISKKKLKVFCMGKADIRRWLGDRETEMNRDSNSAWEQRKREESGEHIEIERRSAPAEREEYVPFGRARVAAREIRGSIVNRPWSPGVRYAAGKTAEVAGRTASNVDKIGHAYARKVLSPKNLRSVPRVVPVNREVDVRDTNWQAMKRIGRR
jgi:hypothetical protein